MTGVVSMEAFFTREKANEGIEVPLYLPSGEKSEHWLRIRGVDSDHFRLAEADSRRKAIDIATIEDTLERAKAIADAKLALIAELGRRAGRSRRSAPLRTSRSSSDRPHRLPMLWIRWRANAPFFSAKGRAARKVR